MAKNKCAETQPETTQAGEKSQEDAKAAPVEEAKTEAQGETVPAPEAAKEDAAVVPAPEPPKEEIKDAAGANETEAADEKEADEAPKEYVEAEAKSCNIFGMWCKA